MRRENLDSTIKTMNDVIYDYFLQSHGISSTTANGKLMDSYKHKSTKELKANVKTLKSQKRAQLKLSLLLTYYVRNSEERTEHV